MKFRIRFLADSYLSYLYSQEFLNGTMKHPYRTTMHGYSIYLFDSEELAMVFLKRILVNNPRAVIEIACPEVDLVLES